MSSSNKEEPAAAPAAEAAAPAASAGGSASVATTNPSIPCSSHQAGVGTAADSCDYTPAPSNFTKAYGKTYVSGAKTNATYALA